MKIPKFAVGAIVGIALLLSSQTAKAALSYAYTFDQSTYNVAANATVNVEVFLQETGANGDPFVLAPSGVGLTGTGVTVSYPSGGVATVASASDIAGNSAFDNGGFGIATSLSSTSAGFTQSILFNPNVTGSLTAPETYEVLLGTFTFTAGPATGSEIITASEFDPSLSEVITGNGAVLDSLIADGTATIDVGPASIPSGPGGSSVPLPRPLDGALVLLVLCVGFMRLDSRYLLINKRVSDIQTAKLA